jgi:hypothetical protein
VNRRRVFLLGLGVTALLVLAGIASSGRPLSGGSGDGPSPLFFDYVYTTITLVAVALFVVFLYGVLTTRLTRPKPRPRKWHVWSAELAWWSLAERHRIAAERAVMLGRAWSVAALVGGGLVAAAFVVGLAGAPGGGLAWTLVGAVAAVLAIGVAAGLARRAPA